MPFYSYLFILAVLAYIIGYVIDLRMLLLPEVKTEIFLGCLKDYTKVPIGALSSIFRRRYGMLCCLTALAWPVLLNMGSFKMVERRMRKYIEDLV